VARIKKDGEYSKLPLKTKLTINVIVFLLNRLAIQIEPLCMAPYFCINVYEAEVEEDEIDLIWKEDKTNKEYKQ